MHIDSEAMSSESVAAVPVHAPPERDAEGCPG